MPAILFALAIFIMSSIPGEKLPPLPFISFDKIVHSLEFGLFGMLLYRAFFFPVPIWKPYLLTLIVSFFYAASDELHQLFVPGRSCDPFDLMMDMVGVIIFAGISKRLNRNSDNKQL